MKKIMVFIVLLSACYKKEIVYEGGAKEGIIIAYFSRSTYSSSQNAELYSDPPFDTSAVEGYVDSLKMYKHRDLYKIHFTSYFYLSYGTSHTLKIFLPQGVCEAEVFIPESVIITYPYDYDTLSFEEAQVIWRVSEGASWYSLALYFNFYDSTGFWIGGESMDISTEDTFLIIKPLIETWFEDSGAAGASASIYVSSLDGPLPGGIGNIRGPLGGYLYAYGEDDNVYFYIGQVFVEKKTAPNS